MDGLPSCALACLSQAVSSSSCSILDVDCICHDAPLTAQVKNCGLQNCTTKDNLRSMKFLYTSCDYPVTVEDNVYPAILVAGIILSSLAVTLRIAGRLIGSKLGLDDAVAALSLAHAIAITAIGLLFKRLGLGHDIWFLPFDHITQILHLFFSVEILYMQSVTLTKISMLLLFLRLFPDQAFRLATKLVLAFTTAWGIAMLITKALSCRPLSYFWTRWDGEHEGVCIDHEQLIWAHASINILLDLVIISLPMPTLLSMNLSWRKKLAICVMFAVGIVVSVVSVFRLVSSIKLDITNNPTKSLVNIGIWSLVEVYLALICACMPGIRAFFNYTYTRFYGKSSQYDYDSSSGGGGRGRGSNAFSSPAVQSRTFQSASREQGEFIRLQEITTESFKT
ncbi:CFEM domain-containing protein [Aspergillus puulaauensis]|uniref:CFEM domain-containing protein n=1 Tax=Aspergillus puulaauensis TaxID=1220207 RepID=A0A7R7XI31_9EURO|nr:uncharacterized protein APUU_30147A [Aspergillus puulaauensis]BCS21922.1 hypothetical protein APUU_30147A [Aspergillus puulaauensis]